MFSLVSKVSFLLILSSCGITCHGHFVPKAKLEFLSPKGLKISLPGNDPNIVQVAFHINVNEEFYGVEHGHYAADITKKKNGRWTWIIPHFRVKQGDIIYYWINVIEEYQSYNGLNREYKVTQKYPHRKLVSNPAPIKKPSCTSSLSTMNGGTPVCRGKVLLDEGFSTLDKWNHQVTVGGPLPEDEFMVFTKEPVASQVKDGRLVITPSLLEDKYNDTFTSNGELTLKGCSSIVPEYCDKRAHHYLILPPIISARLNTKNKFSFRYGTIEIKAKLPYGNWIVPELWLEPMTGPQTDRVVIALSRSSADDSEFGWENFEAGVSGDSQSSFGSKVEDTPWFQQFHTFKIQWTQDHMKFSVDDQEFHRVSSEDFPMLNKEVYISLGVHVARSNDVPENDSGRPWKDAGSKLPVWSSYSKNMMEHYDAMQRFLKFWDAKNSWYPSWSQSSSLEIDHIKIIAE